MGISKNLKAYIDQQFQEMIVCSKPELEPGPWQVAFDRLFPIERKKTSPSTKRKQRQRTRDKKLKALSLLSENMPDEVYQSIKANVIAEYERDPKQRGPKTKATTDLNVFLDICYYLTGKENPEVKDVRLYEWIKEYLESKDYKMKDGKNYYDADAIKGRIRSYKNEDPATIKNINSLIDDSYDRFVSHSD